MAEASLQPARSLPAEADGGEARDFIALLKPRVMSLVVFSGLVGLVLAPGSIHPVLGIVAVLCIAIDADIDAVMSRTQKRPIPAGKVSAEAALAFGCILSAGSVALMGLAVNWLAAGLLAFTILFYVGIYTMWLKRRTPQNIVIGGAAGAFPPMIGWAAVTGDIALGGVVLFLIIFFWTPPHFWALALYRSGDYARAGVPMLPVIAGRDETLKQILIYSLILAPLGVAPVFVGIAGIGYGIFVGVLGAGFVALAAKVYRSDSDKDAKRLFGFSILYLFLLLTGLLVDWAIGLI